MEDLAEIGRAVVPKVEPEPEPRQQCNSTESSPRGPSAVPLTRKQRRSRKKDMVSIGLPVGIEDDREFQVVKRLLGPNGIKTKRIQESAGPNVRVSVKGRGAVLNEKEAGTDASGNEKELKLFITAQGPGAQQSLDRAIASGLELIQSVHREHKEFYRADYAVVTAGPGYGSHPGTSCKRVPMPCQPATWIRQRCSIPVGIPEDHEFRVVAKLVGKKGENLQRIAAEARSAADKASLPLESGKTIVSIRGHGARRDSRFDGDTFEGPLEIVVAAASQAAFDYAAEAIKKLLANVHQQYRHHQEALVKRRPAVSPRLQ